MNASTRYSAYTLLTLTSLLSGCDAIYPFGNENKINHAIPVSSEVENARKAVAEELKGKQRQDFESEWNRRMTLRVLTCAKGYKASLFATASAIREKLTDLSCFQEQDSETAKWIGYLRIGLLLAKPPLRPIPANPPKLITSTEPIRQAIYAEKAGVAALITTTGTLSLIDLGSGQAFVRNKVPEGRPETLSPNGRLIGFGAPSHAYTIFYATETGQEIGRIPRTREWQIHWLGEKHFIYAKDDNKTALVNCASGQEIELPFPNLTRIFPVPGQAQQFIIGSWNAIARVELNDKDGQSPLNILEERKIESTQYWASNTSCQTADGSTIVSQIPSGLAFRDITSLQVSAVDFGPGAGLMQLVCTADPDKVIIRTNAASTTPESGSAVRDYQYSIVDKSLTPLQESMPSRLQFVASLKSIMSTNGNREDLYIPVPVADTPIPIAKIAFERRLREAERKMAYAEQATAINAPRSYSQSQTLAAPSPTQFPLANLAANARIEAIGVYQGQGRRSGSTAPQPSVEIKIRRSDKPIILVLSSYEAVRWILVNEPGGARVDAILLGGYKQSSVLGGGSARVISIGQKYAYSQESREFRDLDASVFQMTGKHIGLLQGRYEGNAFSVGGQM